MHISSPTQAALNVKAQKIRTIAVPTDPKNRANDALLKDSPMTFDDYATKLGEPAFFEREQREADRRNGYGRRALDPLGIALADRRQAERRSVILADGLRSSGTVAR